MTDDQIADYLKEMEEEMGPLPNPDQEPRRAEMYLRLFEFYKTQRS